MHYNDFIFKYELKKNWRLVSEKFQCKKKNIII